jgi:hypothetical protein
VDLSERLLAVLRSRPSGEPVAVSTLARELDRPESEIISAAEALEHRQHGDRDLISLVEQDGEKRYLARTPVPLNEEPEA